MTDLKAIQKKLDKAERLQNQGREDECERLLVAVLREAVKGSEEHWLGLIFMGELYESQERLGEACIVCRDIPQNLSSKGSTGQRGHQLWQRLQKPSSL